MLVLHLVRFRALVVLGLQFADLGWCFQLLLQRVDGQLRLVRCVGLGLVGDLGFLGVGACLARHVYVLVAVPLPHVVNARVRVLVVVGGAHGELQLRVRVLLLLLLAVAIVARDALLGGFR